MEGKIEGKTLINNISRDPPPQGGILDLLVFVQNMGNL